MRIERLEIKNFRGIREMNLDFHKRLNVFTGVNGSGKSSVLDCLARMFSECPILTTDRLDFGLHNITNGEDAFSGMLRCQSFSDWHVTTSLSFSSNEKTSRYVENQSGNPDEAVKDGPLSVGLKHIQQNDDLKVNIPIVVYYATHRAISEIPERIRGVRPTTNQLEALDKALESELDFRSFIKRFRESEKYGTSLIPITEEPVPKDGEFEDDVLNMSKLVTSSIRWLHSQAKVIQIAITSVVPEFSNLRVSQRPFGITIDKHGETYGVLQLSDGEKVLIALVGDLAQRLAIANPSMENPLEGEGVAMIDEIDLHLHPTWQRVVVPRLLETFPNVQFILTTHSPQVLGEIDPDSIRCLYQDDPEAGIQYSIPERSKGLDDSMILDEIMGADTRNEDTSRLLDDLFRLIDEDKFDEARQKKDEIEKLLNGEIPELLEADTMITMLDDGSDE